MRKSQVVQDLSFGNQIAEEEKDSLKEYFVETLSWKKIIKGDVDLVYGPKGSGKSAIYVLIQDSVDSLFDRGIILVSAENVRGDPAFKSLTFDPPTTEREFINLWKLYFVGLIARVLVDYGFDGEDVTEFKDILSECGLLPKKDTQLVSLLKAALAYIRRFAKPTGLESEVALDQNTGGVTGIKAKITFDVPSEEEEKKGLVSIDKVFALAQGALVRDKYVVWVLLDRLDVAFDEATDLEKNALRALFRAYRDIKKYDNIQLKVFLRTDIWKRISDEGFREATHLSKELTIEWSAPALKNLIVRRLLSNKSIIEYYGVDRGKILDDSDKQDEFFYSVFPRQVELGEKQSNTLDWMLKRISDASNKPAPRELIYLLNKATQLQAEKFERGEADPPEKTMFERTTLKEALPALSEYRTTKMLFAEYPEIKPWLMALKREKSEQTPDSLAVIWGVEGDGARERAARLCEVGFFEQRGTKAEPTFWVPFIYRPYFDLSQGRADA